MIILLAVLALVVVNALAQSPWGVFSIAMTIPIALFMGFYLRVLRPGRVLETTAIGVGLLLLAIVAGGWVDDSSAAEFFTLSPETLTLCLVIYGFVASVLPVWMLLAPRDYLSTFMKLGVIFLLALGIVCHVAADGERGGDEVRLQRRGPGLRGRAVPVRLHHHRLRRAVGLPRADRLGDDAEDDPEGVAGPHDRLRRDADGVLRRGLRDHRGLDHRPRPLLRDERAGRPWSATRSSPPRRRSASSASRSHPTSCRPRPARSTSRRWWPAPAARPTLAVGMSRDLLRRLRRNSAEGVLVPLRDHVRGAVHPHHGRRRARASGASCCRTRSATSGSRSGASRWKPGLWATSAIVVGAWGYFLYTGVDEPARRDQPAVPAVRHRQPAARRGRAGRLHDAADQAGQG